MAHGQLGNLDRIPGIYHILSHSISRLMMKKSILSTCAFAPHYVAPTNNPPWDHLRISSLSKLCKNGNISMGDWKFACGASSLTEEHTMKNYRKFYSIYQFLVVSVAPLPHHSFPYSFSHFSVSPSFARWCFATLFFCAL